MGLGKIPNRVAQDVGSLAKRKIHAYPPTTNLQYHDASKTRPAAVQAAGHRYAWGSSLFSGLSRPDPIPLFAGFLAGPCGLARLTLAHLAGLLARGSLLLSTGFLPTLLAALLLSSGFLPTLLAALLTALLLSTGFLSTLLTALLLAA